ncbi:MAG: thioredoxin [archaeon]
MSNLMHINQTNFVKEVQESTTPIIIDFWAEWCAPCRMMGPVFEELSNQYEGKLKFAKLNTETEPALAGSFSIRGIPSLLIMKNGQEIDRIVGFAPKEILKQKIDSVLASI